MEEARLALAASFGETHGARRAVDDGTYPWFVGVFDTVAALINPPLAGLLAMASAIGAVAISFVASLIFARYGQRLPTFFISLLVVVLISAIGTGVAYVREHFKTDYENGCVAPSEPPT